MPSVSLAFKALVIFLRRLIAHGAQHSIRTLLYILSLLKRRLFDGSWHKSDKSVAILPPRRQADTGNNDSPICASRVPQSAMGDPRHRQSVEMISRPSSAVYSLPAGHDSNDDVYGFSVYSASQSSLDITQEGGQIYSSDRLQAAVSSRPASHGSQSESSFTAVSISQPPSPESLHAPLPPGVSSLAVPAGNSALPSLAGHHFYRRPAPSAPNVSRSLQNVGGSSFRDNASVLSFRSTRSFRPPSRASGHRHSRIIMGVPSRPPEQIDILQPHSARSSIKLATPSASAQDLPNTAAHTGNVPLMTHPSCPPPERKYMNPIHAAERYNRNVKLPKRKPGYTFTIPPKVPDVSRQNVPPGWTPCVHPEGALYFHDEKRRIYTDAHLCETPIWEQIEAFAKQLEEVMEEQGVQMTADFELVLELEANPDGGYFWSYYFACHSRRTLFWLEDYDVSWRFGSVPAEVSRTHISHHLEASYWYIQYLSWEHVEFFPHGQQLPEGAADELMNRIVHSLGDKITSIATTVPYSSDELNRMIAMVKHAKSLKENEYTVTIIARLLGVFAEWRFLNFHGEHGARLSSDHSVHGTVHFPQSKFSTLVCAMFFNAPERTRRGLEKIWIDKTLSQLAWEQFITKLHGEWEEFILYATVLLNANVAFLAIPNVAPAAQDGGRTLMQIISYVSVVNSMGCIILGLLLTRQYRAKPRETAEEAAVFLGHWTHPTHGVETLAIIYTLPYGLLMWAMISFSLAFLIMCVQTSDRVSIYVTSLACSVAAVLIFWCMYAAWIDLEKGHLWCRVQETVIQRLLAPLREAVRQRLPGSCGKSAVADDDQSEQSIATL